MCVLRLRSLAEENKSPRRYGWGLRSRASSPRLRGAWFFGRGGFVDLALYIGNAGVGANQYARDGAGGVEPLPEDRKEDDGHVRASGDREGEGHQKSHVEALRRKRQ